MGFSRQEYWSGLPYTPTADLPEPVVIIFILKKTLYCDNIMTIFSESPNWGDLTDTDVVSIKTASGNLDFLVDSLYDHPENRHSFSEII